MREMTANTNELKLDDDMNNKKSLDNLKRLTDFGTDLNTNSIF